MAEEIKAVVNDVHVEEGDLNSLSGVQQLIREAPGCGFQNEDLPVFRWRLLTTNLPALCPLRSTLFVLGKHLGQLTLSHVQESEYIVTLTLDRFRKEAEPENPKSSFSFFVCDFKNFDEQHNHVLRRHASGTAFDTSGDHQELVFAAEVANHAIMVDLRMEHLDTSGYVSPHVNTALGKIEKFKETKENVEYNRLPVYSPRFRFLSLDAQHLCIFRFWNAKLKQEMDKDGVSATLTFLRQPSDLAYFGVFMVSVVFFSAVEGVDDLVIRAVFRSQEDQTEFPFFLAFYFEIEPLLKDPKDDLYYKVVVNKMRRK